MQSGDRQSWVGIRVSRVRELRWNRVLLIVLVAFGTAGRTSYAQLPIIPARGIEEVGRVYIGEPVAAYIGHVAMLFVTGKQPGVSGGTMQDTVDWVNNPLHSCVADGTGGLAVYAHPDSADRVLLLHGLTGMEVFRLNGLPTDSPYRDQMWDAVNSSLSAQGQPLLWGFAADDSHYTVAGAFNYARNVSLVPSVDVFAIKAALRSGAFYITNGPAITGVSSTATTITVNAGQTSDILWLRAGQYNMGSSFTQTTTPGASNAVKIDSSVTTSTLNVSQLGIALGDLHFVRAIVRTSNTTYALTQPFTVSSAGAIVNPYPVGGTWVAGQSHNHDDGWIGEDGTRLTTFRTNYQGVGQQASFETAYSYWENPYQRLNSDGYPDIASVSPPKVAYGSAASITITGVNFATGIAAQIGEYALSNIVLTGSTQLTAVVSNGVPPGTYDVVLTNPDSLRGAAAGAVIVQDATPDNAGWVSYLTPTLPWNQAISIASIGDAIWVGTLRGAAEYRQGSWSTYVPTGGQTVYAQGIYRPTGDSTGGIWFSSVGMWHRDAAGDVPWTYELPTGGATAERWGRTAYDTSGRLWVTSRSSDGIAIRSTAGTWSRLTSANGLPSDDTGVIARDTQGNMWVGFGGGRGAWTWTGSAWQQVLTPSPLDKANDILSITAGPDGDVWMAVAPRNISYTPAQTGVVHFNSNGTTEIYQPPLPQPRVTDILVAHNGDIWFASRGGVARMDRAGEWRTFTAANSGLVSDIVMALAEDTDGRVWFATGNGVSSYLPAAAVITVPAAPTGLSATPTSTSQISLAWTDNSSDESGFRVERSPDGATFTEIATVGANVTAYVSGGLNASTTYAYRVRAYNGGGVSAYSNVASATTLTPAPTVPAAPTNLTGTATATQVTLRWAEHATNEDGFRVERALGTGAFALVATPGPNATGYVDSGLQPKTSYRYRVQAYNAVGASAYSNILSLKTKPK